MDEFPNLIVCVFLVFVSLWRGEKHGHPSVVPETLKRNVRACAVIQTNTHACIFRSVARFTNNVSW